MIDQLIRGLVVGSELSPEEIMDVLWLAATRPLQAASAAVTAGADQASSTEEATPERSSPQAPDGVSAPGQDGTLEDQVPLRLDGEPAGDGEPVPATQVGFGSPRAIRDPLLLPRALRPLKRIRAPGPRVEIDIDATVEATADADRLTIVTTRPLERVLDLALVVDQNSSMRIWDDTLGEFERLLVQTGAFRTVSRWRMTANAKTVRLEDPYHAQHPSRRLVDPSGRRLVFVVTNATSLSWYGPALWRALAVWSGSMPTAIIQILPPHYWPSTAIGEPYITARARRPASPNRQYARRLAWWAADCGEGLVLPVLTLSPEALETWAQAAVSGTAWVAGITATPPDPEYQPLTLTDDNPVAMVNDFLALASPGAERLARVLANAATLSMPLIGVLQERLAPGTGVPELAEILASGLLVERNPSVRVRQPLLRFREGIREILRRGATVFEEWDAYHAVSDYLSERQTLGGPLHALIPDPLGSAVVDLTEDPFAALERSLAIRLGIRTAAQPTETSREPAAVPAPDQPSQPEPPQVRPIASWSGRAGGVLAVAVSPDGSWLATSADDIRVWDAQTAQLRLIVHGHSSAVSALAVSPDARWLASGGMDATVRVRDLGGDQLQVLRDHSGPVTAMSSLQTADGRWLLISGGEDGTVRIWDPVTGQQWMVLHAHLDAVTALAAMAMPDGRVLVASGGTDWSVRVWDAATGQQLSDMTAPSSSVTSLACLGSQNGQFRLFSGTADGTVRVFNLDGQAMDYLQQHAGAVTAMATMVTPDGRELLVFGDANGTVQVWDPNTGRQLADVQAHVGAVNAVAVSLDASWFVSGGADGMVRIWDRETGRQLAGMSASRDTAPDSEPVIADDLTRNEAGELTQEEIIALAEAFPLGPVSRNLLQSAGFPSGRIPAASTLTAFDFWSQVAEQVAMGVIPDGRRRLLAVARQRFPGNTKFADPPVTRDAPDASPSTAITSSAQVSEDTPSSETSNNRDQSFPDSLIKIGLWGAPASGKTTYLAALRIAATENSSAGRWAIYPVNESSSNLMVNFTHQIVHNRQFPEATPLEAESNLQWLFVGDLSGSKFALRRSFMRRRRLEARFVLDLIDFSGEAFGSERGRRVPAHIANTALDHLAESQGVIYFFDPIAERDHGVAADYVNRTLVELRKISIIRGSLIGQYLPHYISVCVTKFDHPAVFQQARRHGLVNFGPDGIPRVLDEHAEEFFDMLCTGTFWERRAEQSSASAKFVRSELRNNFHPDRIRYFVSSSIGFWKPPGWNTSASTFNPEDFANSRLVEDAPEIRGAINPINVLEPLISLQQRITRG